MDGLSLPKDYRLLTQPQRRLVREEYRRIQKDNCAHCGTPLTTPPVIRRAISSHLFPVGFFRHPIHLHHSHKTGMTIGAIHAYCNAVLWQYHGE